MSLTSSETKNLIQRNLRALSDQIVLDEDLWIELEGRRVVTDTQRAQIICNDRNIIKTQIVNLLKLLPKRGEEKFLEFCLALEATDQSEIVTHVLKLDLQELHKKKAVKERASIGTHGYGTGNAAVGSCSNPADGRSCTDMPGTPAAISRSSSGSGDASESVSLDESLHNSESSPENLGVSSRVKRTAEEDLSQTAGIKKFRTEPPGEKEGDDLSVTDAYTFREFHVRSSTEEHYKVHADPSENYPMYKRVRGLAIIVNVQQAGVLERRGTNKDALDMQHLLRQFHFEVVLYNDEDGLTAQEICDKVESFSKDPRHEAANCAVMILLSHGKENLIYGTDGNEVTLSRLYRMMDCRALLQKPKVVLVQACRGDDTDDGHELTAPTAMDEDQEDCKVPSLCDFFIGLSVQQGYRSHRNVLQGSWYIQAIVQVFKKFAATHSLTELMTKVNDKVALKESKPNLDMERHRKKQVPDPHYSLRRNLYFFPGIQRSCP